MTVNEMYPTMKRKFTPVELERLATLELPLQEVVIETNKVMAIFILEGHRGQEAQDRYFAEGKSKVKWPDGNHNTLPSKAVDIAPLIDGKIQWNNWQQFAYMNGIVKGVASMLGIKVRLGIDFNMNNVVTDDKFKDAPHVELAD